MYVFDAFHGQSLLLRMTIALISDSQRATAVNAANLDNEALPQHLVNLVGGVRGWSVLGKFFGRCCDNTAVDLLVFQ